MKRKILIQKISFFRIFFADILFEKSDNKYKIQKDLSRYLEETPYQTADKKALNYCLIFNKPFRNIFYYRTEKYHILRGICRLFLKPVQTVEIAGGEIGEGFRIDHNFCVIRPYKAGKNLTVRNGVTIGKGKAAEKGNIENPIIGDNVDIYANAVIFGGIHIGNGVKIGAGAIVNKDVPDDCIVVGNPMRIIPGSGKEKNEG